MLVVGRRLAEAREADHADLGLERLGAQRRQLVRRRPQHRQAGRDQARVALAGAVREVLADQRRHLRPERHRHHRRGVRRQAGRERLVHHHHASRSVRHRVTMRAHVRAIERELRTINGETARMARLDATDWAILGVLQDDARTSNRDLAAAVHVSPSTSSERVRACKADGVIRGYHADVDYGALGRHVQALTAVTIRPPTREIVEAFRNWVVELPEIVGVFVVSGAADFLLHVAVPDTDALYAFVIDRLTERPEVADVNTSVVYEHIRRTVLEPLA